MPKTLSAVSFNSASHGKEPCQSARGARLSADRRCSKFSLRANNCCCCASKASMLPSTCRKEGRNSNCKLLLEKEFSLCHREIIGIETQDAVLACMHEGAQAVPDGHCYIRHQASSHPKHASCWHVQQSLQETTGTWESALLTCCSSSLASGYAGSAGCTLLMGAGGVCTETAFSHGPMRFSHSDASDQGPVPAG